MNGFINNCNYKINRTDENPFLYGIIDNGDINMDLVEIFEVIFGVGFIILALIGSKQIFGGIFYSKKVKAVVSEKKSEVYIWIDGQRYTDRHEINLAKKRDMRRHIQKGDRRKQKYREHRIDSISFTYDDGGVTHTTDPKTTICPVSTSFIDVSKTYNIMVSRKYPWKARIGLFEVLKETLCMNNNIIIRFILCIIIICNALIYLVADVGLAALGVWIINIGINGIR